MSGCLAVCCVLCTAACAGRSGRNFPRGTSDKHRGRVCNHLHGPTGVGGQHLEKALAEVATRHGLIAIVNFFN